MNKVKPIINLVGITFIAFVFFFALVELEENLIKSWVIPDTGITQQEWIDSFRTWALVGIVVAWFTSVIWYVLAQWGFKVNETKDTTARHIWFLLFLFPVVGVVISILLTPQTEEGAWVPKIFHLVNGILSYYLATVLFSPSAFKYTPPLAKLIRRW